MITLDMLKKSAPVRISIGHFSTENNIVLLPIKLMSGEVDYDLDGKTITASFEGKPMTAPLEVIEGVIQLQVTNDLLSVGENRIQLAINWPGNKQELSPIMLWRILSPIVPGTDHGSIDILSSLINQTNEAIAKETEREQAEINRNIYEAFDPLKAYKVNNKVSYQGSSYICTDETAAGTLPTNETYWMLIASKGEKGDEGLSAYEVWIAEGNVGTMDDYLASLKGVKGDPGLPGGNVVLDDAVAATNKVWSSSKISAQLEEKVQNFKIKNEISNGSFESDFTGLVPLGALHPTISQEYAKDGIKSVKFNTNNQSSVVFKDIICNVGDKLYSKINCYLTSFTDGVNVTRTLEFFTLGGFTNGTLISLDKNKLNQWQLVSGLRTADGNGSRIVIGSTGNTTRTLYADCWITLNLTSVFGAGNEPTKLEMDELMKVIPNGWWDGEMTLTQKQDITWKLNLWRKTTNAVIALGGTIV